MSLIVIFVNTVKFFLIDFVCWWWCWSVEPQNTEMESSWRFGRQGEQKLWCSLVTLCVADVVS